MDEFVVKGDGARIDNHESPQRTVNDETMSAESDGLSPARRLIRLRSADTSAVFDARGPPGRWRMFRVVDRACLFAVPAALAKMNNRSLYVDRRTLASGHDASVNP